MDWSIFMPPLVGAVIGLITNDIAIRMLFHPRKPVYIGKWRVPFTPGLIPKEKARVAKSLGNVISTQLLDTPTLKKVFLSDKVLHKIRRALEVFVDQNRRNTQTVEEVILNFAPKEVVKRVYAYAKEDITELAYIKLTKVQFGEGMAKNVFMKIKREKVDGKLFGLLSTIINESVIERLSKNVGSIVDQAIAENAKDIIKEVIGTEVDRYKKYRICDLIEKYDEKIPYLIDFAINTYQKIFEERLEQILYGINIAQIVEEKVASFNVRELETMIFGIMKKELNAIVYLGAVLGFLMGWINIFL